MTRFTTTVYLVEREFQSKILEIAEWPSDVSRAWSDEGLTLVSGVLL